MVAENMRTQDRLDNLLPEIIEWRRDIHQHPELGYEVHRTAALVAEKLKEFGCDEVVQGIGQTGVVGIIRGRKVSSNKVIGLRADMDALPIIEASGAEWSSKTEGQMHACGHDGHTAMLLGAAQGLCDSRDFDGTVAVIFQPAEEGGGGGEAMVLDGMMDQFGINEVYGMHNMPGLPLGEFALRPGPFMAAADEFEITVQGQGGHAAMPHVCKDTLLAASHIVIALQSIVARNIRPIHPAVISVTTMQGDTEAFNVTPQIVTMRGTVPPSMKRCENNSKNGLSKLPKPRPKFMGRRLRYVMRSDTRQRSMMRSRPGLPPMWPVRLLVTPRLMMIGLQ